MVPNQTRRKKWRGITLLELLIVAAIMLSIMVISVPVLKPMLQSQATSNAATVVSSYLNRARTRAMLTGRPCGVTFEVWPGSGDYYNSFTDYAIDLSPTDTGQLRDLTYSASLILRQVETPPFYCGLVEGTTVSLDNNGDIIFPVPTDDLYWSDMVDTEQSPKVQFNGTGPFYPLRGGQVRSNNGMPNPRHLFGQTGLSFKVQRDPRPSMTAPISLPQGTVIDLQYSGVDDVYCQTNINIDQPGVTIMFRPDGSVDTINGLYDSGANQTTDLGYLRANITARDFIPSGTIYLLIGRWERIAALWATEDDIQNINDANNFWISINPRSGMVSVNEVNAAIGSALSLQEALAQSRLFARQSKRNIGGQ